MAHRVVELLIGRLITDEEFRADFTRNPEGMLLGLKDHGFDLSATEIAALAGTDPFVWHQAAEQVDPRLRKLDLSAADARRGYEPA
jgi:hypothetical protein